MSTENKSTMENLYTRGNHAAIHEEIYLMKGREKTPDVTISPESASTYPKGHIELHEDIAWRNSIKESEQERMTKKQHF